MRFFIKASVIAGMFIAASAYAADPMSGNIENGKNIYMNGKGDTVPACFTCHAEDGMGDDFMGTPAFKLNKSCGSITPFSNKVFKSLLEALVICVLASASGAS